ncbi:MAG: FAD-binding oxidoreductase, partial [Bacteroidetes bacterium]|nr:FAD-binding oxidoreductase [Bacteroidota bacterium]
LRDVALLSQREYESWLTIPGFDFAWQHKGLLEIFQTPEKEEHAHHTVEQAHELGLTDTKLLSAGELQALEPHTKLNAKGAILFRCDAHLYPNKLMQGLLAQLRQKGVQLIGGEEALRFEKKGSTISKVITARNAYEADLVVVATGSWSREIAALMDLKLSLMPGRGYSVTLENSPWHVNYPAVLMEGRAAITPMDGNKIRFGGTMEITRTGTPPRMNRVQGILNAVKRYYTEFDVPFPPMEKIWYGYRPCSADGLPYIGRTRKWTNTIVATGHSMLGLSLGAGTGKLVSEIANDRPVSMDISPFAVERFGG